MNTTTRYQTFNGEGLEQGMFTLAEARAKWSEVEFDAETKTISVDGAKPRYTIHQIRDPNFSEIGAAVLAEAATAEEAGEIARKIATGHYYGVATLDNEVGVVDFGNETRALADVSVIED
jgi:hypothetical protein